MPLKLQTHALRGHQVTHRKWTRINSLFNRLYFLAECSSFALQGKLPLVGCLGIYLAVVQLTYMLGLLSHICFLFHLKLGTLSFWQESTGVLRQPVPFSLGSGKDCTGYVILDWIFPAFSFWEINLLRLLALPWSTGNSLPGSLYTVRLWFKLGFFSFAKARCAVVLGLAEGSGSYICCYICPCSTGDNSIVLLWPVLRAQWLVSCWAIWQERKQACFLLPTH